MFCKHGLCTTETENGYCDAHGGAERQLREWEEGARRAEARAQAQSTKPKGQAAAEGQGLARFSRAESEEEKHARKARAEKNRAEREEERKTWLANIPKRGETNQSGTGTSKKARKRQKMSRKLRQRQ